MGAVSRGLSVSCSTRRFHDMMETVGDGGWSLLREQGYNRSTRFVVGLACVAGPGTVISPLCDTDWRWLHETQEA